MSALVNYCISFFISISFQYSHCVAQRWQVFQKMRDLDTIVPPLLGLKGNLEMTLASRLSTQVHVDSLLELTFT